MRNAPAKDVLAEMDLMARHMPQTRRIFLADGDALNLDTDYMVDIVSHLRRIFPKLERHILLRHAHEHTQKDPRGAGGHASGGSGQCCIWA